MLTKNLKIKIIVLAVIILIGVVYLVYQRDTVEALQTYKNAEFGFEIAYPTSWSADQDTKSQDTNIIVLREFAVKFSGKESNELIGIEIYSKNSALHVKDWATIYTLFGSNIFLTPPDWTQTFTAFNAKADSVGFTEPETVGGSMFYIWAEKNDKIFKIWGRSTEKNLQTISTFKFLE